MLALQASLFLIHTIPGHLLFELEGIHAPMQKLFLPLLFPQLSRILYKERREEKKKEERARWAEAAGRQ